MHVSLITTGDRLVNPTQLYSTTNQPTAHLSRQSCTSCCTGSTNAVLLVTASNTASLVLGGRADDTRDTMSSGPLQ